MAEDQNAIDNMEIEPLSDEELESVAGGTDSPPATSTGPTCCSLGQCSCCSHDSVAPAVG